MKFISRYIVSTTTCSYGEIGSGSAPVVVVLACTRRGSYRSALVALLVLAVRAGVRTTLAAPPH